MKRRGKLLLVSGLLASGLTVGAPSASADTPNCVSAAEIRYVYRYDNKEIGWTRTRIARIFDVRGKRTAYDYVTNGRHPYEIEARNYKRCSGGRTWDFYFARPIGTLAPPTYYFGPVGPWRNTQGCWCR